MFLFTATGIALIGAGIALTGYGDGLRRASRACADDPSTAIAEDPRAVITLRRGVALMVLGLVVVGLGAL